MPAGEAPLVVPDAEAGLCGTHGSGAPTTVAAAAAAFAISVALRAHAAHLQEQQTEWPRHGGGAKEQPIGWMLPQIPQAI